LLESIKLLVFPSKPHFSGLLKIESMQEAQDALEKIIQELKIMKKFADHGKFIY